MTETKYETTFRHGLRLTLPTGGTRLLCACEWHDDPKYIIDGQILSKFENARSVEPCKTETLPVGTIVRLWDDDGGHPMLGTIGGAK